MTALPASERDDRAVLQPPSPLRPAMATAWSCGRCRAQFRILRIRAVVSASSGRQVPYGFMACIGCGGARSPYRLELDRRRLRDLAAARHPDPDLRRTVAVVDDHASDVVAMRRAEAGPELTVRSVDTHRLADRLRTDRRELVHRLDALDVLIGLEIAARPPHPPAIGT